MAHYDTNRALGTVIPERTRLSVGLEEAGAYKSWTKDPETGYLTPPPNQRGLARFGAKEKKKFVELAKDLFPNLSAVCELMGFSVQAYRNQYIIDSLFKQDMDNLKDRSIDLVEKTMFDMARRPQNFMDRIAIMRAYRGEIYNPKSTVTFKHEISAAESMKRRTALASAIDVEVIKASTEVLEAEVVEPLTVPGSLNDQLVISPAGGAPDDSQSHGGASVDEPRLRDPLSTLEE